jgi:enoyl-CoA hydratase/carnithine racemase
MSDVIAERVSVTLEDGIVSVRLTRPEKRNALDPAMMEALIAAGEQVKSMPGARAVVLSGDGASFCAGLDLGRMQSLAGDGDGGRRESIPVAVPEGEITHRGQQVCWVWQEVPVPVVAAVQGHALGGGLQLALAADIRVIHPDAQLSLREIHWGLVPDGTGSLTLGRLARPDILKDLLFSGRIFSGREAGELGVATVVSDTPLQAAQALARGYAERSPAALRAAKELANHLLYGEAAEQFAAERRLIHGLAGTAEQAEAVRAHFEKRAPVFP